MNLKEEFKDNLDQIQNELLKNTSSPFYSHLLKDFMNDSDKFMSFYDFIMNSQDIYDFEIYKGLLGPLNSFGFYAEIGQVYNKMIKGVIENDIKEIKDIKDNGGYDIKDKDKVDKDSNNNTTHSSLFLVSLLDSHSSKFLRNLFSPSLSISLILFGDFLFKNKFFYESFKVLNVVSQSIPITGYPPKEVLDKYWFIIGYFFLREGSYYSFMNCINKENMKRFGSKEDYKKILKIIKIKNEGNEFKKLLLKKNREKKNEEIWREWCIENDIKDYNTCKDHNTCNDYNTCSPSSLINSLVPFSNWDFYFNFLDKEIDLKDFNFISFLKKNNLDFEIKENKIKIGKYKFKSISDKIYDIIEKYKEDGKDNDDDGEDKDGGISNYDGRVNNKDKGINKGTPLYKTPFLKNTPLLKNTLYNKSTPSFKKSFKDNFSLSKSKYKIYSLILSKIKKNFKMKNENLLKNRKNQFENFKIKEEEKRERLKEYYEIVKELIKEIENNSKMNSKNKERNLMNKEVYINRNIPIKTNWRDLEVNDLQKSTFIGRQYRTKQREDDILSSRTISSFDRTEDESKGSKVYKPNMNIKDLKILSKGEGKERGDDNNKEGGKGKYIPPHLRK